jgi:two-component system, cell cycle sensor histidine kinase and response regulator CckA
VIQGFGATAPSIQFAGLATLSVVAVVFAVIGGFVGRAVVLRRQPKLRASPLTRQDDRYRLFFESNPCPMWVYDLPTAAIIEVNDAAIAQYGYTRDEFARMTLRDLRAPEDAARLEGMLRETKPDAEMLHLARHIRKNGTRIDVEVRGRPLAIPGRALRLVVITDCTDRLTTARGIRESEARATATNAMLQTLIDAAPLPMIVTDTDLNLTRWNRAAESLFGWTAAEVLGKPAPFFPEDQLADAQARRARSMAGEAIPPAEVIRSRKDGTRIHLMVAVSPLSDSDGRVTGVISIFTDLTERNLLEGQLRQAQKMEAIGTLAGGVAHDFNNLLTIILSYSEMLLAGPLAADIRADVEEIALAARRATALTSRLLAFSRKAIVQLRPVDVNDVVRGMEIVFRRLLMTNIELTTTLSVEPSVVIADPGQIEQVLMNLIGNASDAMPDGGSLVIETQNVELDDDYERTHAGVRPGSYVMLAVTDTGVGMDAATASKIFEPFFTTKGVGRGTGLGLATVYAIVKQLEGHVWVYSERGHGTTFKIYIPRDLSAQSVEGGVAPREAPAQRSGTALLVEDDDAVRRAVRRMLERLGYDVIEAPDGEAGLSIAAEHDGPIDIAITDLMMPRMNGLDFADALQKTHPGLRVVFASGYTDATVLQRGLLTPAHTFLQKPFTADQLAQAINTLSAPG